MCKVPFKKCYYLFFECVCVCVVFIGQFVPCMIKATSFTIETYRVSQKKMSHFF